MEMKSIVRELEEKLKETAIQMKEWEAKKKFWVAAVESAEKELTELKDNMSNLEMMIEAAKGVKEKKTAAENVIKKTKGKNAEETDSRHKGACVLKINEYDNIEDRWRTQKEAANALNLDQSSLSKFMKLDKCSQFDKKGYAIVWEY